MIDAMGFVTGGAATLALLAWFASTTTQRGELSVPARTTTVEDALRKRLEQGEISLREFEDALGMLKDS